MVVQRVYLDTHSVFCRSTVFGIENCVSSSTEVGTMNESAVFATQVTLGLLGAVLWVIGLFYLWEKKVTRRWAPAWFLFYVFYVGIGIWFILYVLHRTM
jgi:drug/metabolite transporter (DMT)-like permease